MKTQIRLAALLVATLGGFLAPVLTAAPTQLSAAAQPVRQIIRDRDVAIAIGTFQASVCHQFGWPDRKLTENVWVYNQFQAEPPREPVDDCHTLVITFRDDKVVDMKLVNPRAMKVLIAQAKRDPSALAKVYVPAKAGAIETADNKR